MPLLKLLGLYVAYCDNTLFARNNRLHQLLYFFICSYSFLMLLILCVFYIRYFYLLPFGE